MTRKRIGYILSVIIALPLTILLCFYIAESAADQFYDETRHIEPSGSYGILIFIPIVGLIDLLLAVIFVQTNVNRTWLQYFITTFISILVLFILFFVILTSIGKIGG